MKVRLSSLRRIFLSPFRALWDARDFRRLRRLLPTTPRMWVPQAYGRIRPESDAEYLSRLRQLALERFPPGQRNGFPSKRSYQ